MTHTVELLTPERAHQLRDVLADCWSTRWKAAAR